MVEKLTQQKMFHNMCGENRKVWWEAFETIRSVDLWGLQEGYEPS